MSCLHNRNLRLRGEKRSLREDKGPLQSSVSSHYSAHPNATLADSRDMQQSLLSAHFQRTPQFQGPGCFCSFRVVGQKDGNNALEG